MWSIPPAFAVTLGPTPGGKGGYQFTPSLRDVEATASKVLEHFVQAVGGIPRVGADATAASRRIAHIPAVGLEESAVSEARDRVTAVLRANATAPEALAALFEPYMHLLSMDAPEYLRSFAEASHTLEEYAAGIDKLREEADAISNLMVDEVRTGIFCIRCGPLKAALRNAALDLSSQLLDQVRRAALDSNSRICETFGVMAVEVMRPASTGEEVLALKKYIAKGAAQQEQLAIDIAANRDREEFLEKYRHEVTDMDFLMAIRAYEWPKKMSEIMREATQKVAGEHKAFEDSLKARRIAFAETLGRAQVEVDAFDTIGALAAALGRLLFLRSAPRGSSLSRGTPPRLCATRAPLRI